VGLVWREIRLPAAAVMVVTLATAGTSADSAAASAPAAASPMPTPTPTSACAAAWSMYQQDAAHTGSGCSTLTTLSAATLHPAWFTSTAGAVTAEPVVADDTVFVGDSTGIFHAVNQSTGATRWTFATTALHSCFLDKANPSMDLHGGGFGAITSSAAVLAGPHPTLYFGGGATLYALDAVTGTCEWAQDLDPDSPTTDLELESSPVIDTSVSPPEVIVGDDDNSGAGRQVTGLFAFNATTGALLWRYEPERDVTLYPSEFDGSDALTLSCGDGSANSYCTPANVPGIGLNASKWADACGDVWSSPILDPSFIDPAGDNTYQSLGSQAGTDPVWRPKRITATGRPARDGLVMMGTGNCGANPTPATTYAHDDYAHGEGEFALDPVTGVRVWNWFEPLNLYNTDSPTEAGGGDDDFGSSPILATIPDADFKHPDPCPSFWGSTTLVIQGGKSGYAYGICERTGTEVWGVHSAQAGQLSPNLVGSVGGFIGSASLGVSSGRPTAFFDSAIPLPFAGDGVIETGTTKAEPATGTGTGGAGCPTVTINLPELSVCPDTTLPTDPARLLTVQALDAATGRIVWRSPAGPSYAATTYANGVVFAASTTTFSLVAYDADNGLPLWHFPLGAAAASGAAIVGQNVIVGSGLSEREVNSTTIPPGANGIWCFTVAVP
jgi:outer membrane protein assembly factor BamB